MPALFLPPDFAYQSIPDPALSSSMASGGRPDLASSSKDILSPLNSPTQNQKTPKHRLTRRAFSCLFYLLNTSTELQHGTTQDEKHAFASPAMLDIQYLIKE